MLQFGEQQPALGSPLGGRLLLASDELQWPAGCWIHEAGLELLLGGHWLLASDELQWSAGHRNQRAALESGWGTGELVQACGLQG